jgi:toxin ParE1/3/4
MIPYTIALRAQNDLAEIWSYVVRDSLVAADRLIEMFHQKFLLLAAQPFMGESRETLQSGLRAFSAGNYVILYRLVQNGIDVVRVIHAARDIGEQL